MSKSNRIPLAEFYFPRTYQQALVVTPELIAWARKIHPRALKARNDHIHAETFALVERLWDRPVAPLPPQPVSDATVQFFEMLANGKSVGGYEAINTDAWEEMVEFARSL